MTEKMKPRTLKALKASIAHWEENAADPKSATIGPDSCALCNLFNHEDMDDEDRCHGCPVAYRTEQSQCQGSTYYDVYCALAEHDMKRSADSHRRAVAACRRMAKFLRSLLPKGER